jgi:hypothetical protein
MDFYQGKLLHYPVKILTIFCLVMVIIFNVNEPFKKIMSRLRRM